MTRTVTITQDQDDRLEQLAPVALRGTNRASLRVQAALDQFLAMLDPKYERNGGQVYAAAESQK